MCDSSSDSQGSYEEDEDDEMDPLEASSRTEKDIFLDKQTSRTERTLAERIALQKKEHFNLMLKPMALNIVIEVSLCTIYSLSFVTATYILWTTFAALMVIRCFSMFLFKMLGCGAYIVNPVIGLLSLISMAVYMCFLATALVEACKYQLTKKGYWTATEYWTGRANELFVESFDIICPDKYAMFVSNLPVLLGQVGIPTCATFYFVSLSILFQLGKVGRYGRIMQRKTITTVDVCFFITSVWAPDTFVFLQVNPMWFWCVRLLFMIAYSATVAHGCLAGMALSSNFDCKLPDHLRCGLKTQMTCGIFWSLALVDLPLMLVRGYFAFAGLHVNYLFLGKNVLFSVDYLSLLILGAKNNWITTVTETCTNMLPYADKMDKIDEPTRAQLWEESERNLENQQKQMKIQQDQINALQTISKLMRHEIGGDDHRVTEAFSYFDMDDSGKLSKQEMDKICGMLAMTGKEYDKFEAQVDKLFQGKGAMEIKEFVSLITHADGFASED